MTRKCLKKYAEKKTTNMFVGGIQYDSIIKIELTPIENLQKQIDELRYEIFKLKHDKTLKP